MINHIEQCCYKRLKNSFKQQSKIEQMTHSLFNTKNWSYKRWLENENTLSDTLERDLPIYIASRKIIACDEVLPTAALDAGAP